MEEQKKHKYKQSVFLVECIDIDIIAISLYWQSKQKKKGKSLFLQLDKKMAQNDNQFFFIKYFAQKQVYIISNPKLHSNCYKHVKGLHEQRILHLITLHFKIVSKPTRFG